MPTGKVIEKAYEAGDNYDPVIRAAQNQWFINTFIYEENNPSVNSPVFHLVPHAPQNRGTNDIMRRQRILSPAVSWWQNMDAGL